MRVTDIEFKSLLEFTTIINNRLKTYSFTEPPQKDLRIFFQTVYHLLTGNIKAIKISANTVGYDFFELNDDAVKRTYFILTEKPKHFRGLGTYIFAAHYERNLILQVPHPQTDERTVREGTIIMQKTNARALFISGTRRDSNHKSMSPCSGRYNISDVAHFTENFFQAAHRATLTIKEKPISISLHGMGGKNNHDILLSDGTTFRSASSALVNRLRYELLIRGQSVGSCNSNDNVNSSLCGTTNVQGRLSNNSIDACKIPANQSTGLFLHIEQKKNIRNNPRILIDALNAVIPLVNI